MLDHQFWNEFWTKGEQVANNVQHRESLAPGFYRVDRAPSSRPLEGFEDFDFAFFAEDVYGDACGIAVDDYVAVGAGDA